jgi:hypothetical protein
MSEMHNPSSGRLEVIEGLNQSIEYTRNLLFQPFNWSIWWRFGLIVFIEQLARGGGGGRFNFNVPGGNAGEIIEPVVDWFRNNQELAILLILCIIGLGLLLSLLFMWLGSRANIMFVRAVALRNPTIKENWAASKKLGWSLFLFRIAFSLIMLVIGGAILALAAITLIPVFANGFENAAVTGSVVSVLILLALLFVPIAITAAFVQSFLRNLIAPIMYRFDIPCMEAWRLFRQIARGNLGPLCIYVIIRICYSMVFGIAAAMLGCITCCILFLPVVHQIAMSPFYVFDRAYSLFVLESLGPEFEMFHREAPAD